MCASGEKDEVEAARSERQQTLDCPTNGQGAIVVLDGGKIRPKKGFQAVSGKTITM